MKKDAKTVIRVSDIFNKSSIQGDGSGYLGFVITYANGEIENKILDYDQMSFNDVKNRIKVLRLNIINYYRIEGNLTQIMQ